MKAGASLIGAMSLLIFSSSALRLDRGAQKRRHVRCNEDNLAPQISETGTKCTSEQARIQIDCLSVVKMRQQAGDELAVNPRFVVPASAGRYIDSSAVHAFEEVLLLQSDQIRAYGFFRYIEFVCDHGRADRSALLQQAQDDRSSFVRYVHRLGKEGLRGYSGREAISWFSSECKSCVPL